MSRFVILVHDHPFHHWDLLLENGDACRSWRLLDAPDSAASILSAEELSDHRSMYLDYEGPVSEERGSVSRWDRGTLRWRINQPDICEAIVVGQRWRGLVRLTRTNEMSWKCVREFGL